METTSQLNAQNFRKGMLVDEELMAGISETVADGVTSYAAFVLRHTTGEYLGFQAFTQLEPALAALNRIPRGWVYEATGGCGGGNCSKANGGACNPLGCGKQKPKTAPDGTAESVAGCSSGGCGS